MASPPIVCRKFSISLIGPIVPEHAIAGDVVGTPHKGHTDKRQSAHFCADSSTAKVNDRDRLVTAIWKLGVESAGENSFENRCRNSRSGSPSYSSDDLPVSLTVSSKGLSSPFQYEYQAGQSGGKEKQRGRFRNSSVQRSTVLKIHGRVQDHKFVAEGLEVECRNAISTKR